GFASNRGEKIGYCRQSRREFSPLLAPSPSFLFFINGCVCHLLTQLTSFNNIRLSKPRSGCLFTPATRLPSPASTSSVAQSEIGQKSLSSNSSLGSAECAAQ